MNLILPAAVVIGLGIPVYNLLGNYLQSGTQGTVSLPPVGGTYVSIFALIGLLAFIMMLVFK